LGWLFCLFSPTGLAFVSSDIHSDTIREFLLEPPVLLPEGSEAVLWFSPAAENLFQGGIVSTHEQGKFLSNFVTDLTLQLASILSPHRRRRSHRNRFSSSTRCCHGFTRLTGYPVDSVIGRNCRFLQGPGTDPDTVSRLRDAIAGGLQCTVQLLNYRQDGTSFWNRLSVTPVRDESGLVTNYIGVQSDVTEQKNAEEALQLAKGALEQANRRMQLDLRAAATVQRALLPQSLPVSDHLKMSWKFRPCSELAGDILNAFRLDNDHVALYMLDVSGHGVAAALLAVTVSRLMSPMRERSFLYSPELSGGAEYSIEDPADVARTLNDYFPFNEATRQYFTLMYAVLNIRTLELRYVAAGHPHSIHIRSRDQANSLPATGPPIGMLSDASYETGTLQLQSLDRLYLYSDGISESENRGAEAFGEDRLLQTLADRLEVPLTDSVESVMAELNEWVGDRPLEDDASILALQVR
jgi:sigma-B regulation protein RsbU (phosphoserine phosphatase)